jgi:hypothetical protein
MTVYRAAIRCLETNERIEFKFVKKIDVEAYVNAEISRQFEITKCVWVREEIVEEPKPKSWWRRALAEFV